jgi:hypothetical protein
LPFRDLRYKWYVTFDIEHVRYRHTISIEKIIDIDEHLISKSSISNITFDIERPTLDIGVPRIQMKMEARLHCICACFFSAIEVMHAYECARGNKSCACSRTWITKRQAYLIIITIIDIIVIIVLSLLQLITIKY